MKSGKLFWTSLLLLVVLGLGGCSSLANQNTTMPADQDHRDKHEWERDFGS